MNKEDIDYYGAFAPVLIEKQELVLDELKRILGSLEDDPENAPAEHTACRIKSAKSLSAKLKGRGLEDSAMSGIANLADIIGVRIITHFVGDVYLVLEAIKNSQIWEIDNVKDYIANPKPNGYRSLHVIIRLPADAALPDGIKAEIQLRTVAMDCWASLEHQLKYKKSIQNTELIVSELKRCADEMASTDLSMQTIRDMLK